MKTEKQILAEIAELKTRLIYDAGSFEQVCFYRGKILALEGVIRAKGVESLA